jgi:hypothetical protein
MARSSRDRRSLFIREKRAGVPFCGTRLNRDRRAFATSPRRCWSHPQRPEFFGNQRLLRRGTKSSDPSPSSRESASLRISPAFLTKPAFSASLGTSFSWLPHYRTGPGTVPMPSISFVNGMNSLSMIARGSYPGSAMTPCTRRRCMPKLPAS